MFKNRIDRYLIKAGYCVLHIDEKIVGLAISQWLPFPLAIWNLLFGMAILLKDFPTLKFPPQFDMCSSSFRFILGKI